MGNCISPLCHPHHANIAKTRILLSKGELKIEQEIPAIANFPSRLFDGHSIKIMPCVEPQSPPPLNPTLEPGEMLNGNSHFIRIVLTKKQLESILRDGNGIPYVRDIAVGFLEKLVEEECPKWRPSLATIPEVSKY